MRDDTSLQTLLPRLLSPVKRPGDFCGAGAVDLPVVRITVDGFGILGLPIARAQAEGLLAIATPAPYGRGADTLVDRDVRRCGQIAASAVHADDPRWRQIVEGVANAAARALGVEGTITSQLYKLLVYQSGDFFTLHRDTEKTRGMFATLVIVLPSDHEGGELIVRHDGQEATLDLSGVATGAARWAAFYTDCQHELLPVRVGHRVALVYNLVRPKGRATKVPDARPTIARVVKALRAWAATPDSPPKLVYPLTHAYTSAELAFATLKNEDAAVAGVLEAAAAQAGCVLRLAMVSIEESGSAEAVPSGRFGRYHEDDYEDDYEDDDCDFEDLEVLDSDRTLDDWRRPDDTVELLGPIPFFDEEVAPPDALADEEPDEQHFHGATGNEGSSFERTWRRAALVLWPASRELEVLCQAGPEATVALLDRLVEQGDEARAHALAILLIDDWAKGDSGPLRARLLAVLARMKDVNALWRFLREVVAAGEFDGSEVDTLIAVLARYDAAANAEILTPIAALCTPARFAHVTRLLRGAGAQRPGVHLAAPVRAVINALARVGEGAPGHGDRAPRSRGLVDLVEVVGLAGDAAALGEELAIAVLDDPARWPFDTVIVPAALEFGAGGNAAWRAATEPLVDAALMHLGARTAQPLEPPANAMRSTAGLTCACANCAALRAFLSDRVTTTWSLKAAKAHREHVEFAIARAGSELDRRTQTRGSPHVLICTKNRAAYDARMRQRTEDLKAIATLEAR